MMLCETRSNNSLGNYYAFFRASAVISHNGERERERKIGIVIAESRSKLIVVDDEIKREHLYLIPKTNVDHYGSKQVYFNIPESSLEKFEM